MVEPNTVNYYVMESIQNFDLNKLTYIMLPNKDDDIKDRFYEVEEGRSTFNILTGKPSGKRPLGRPRSRWDPEEIGINAGNWVD